MKLDPKKVMIMFQSDLTPEGGIPNDVDKVTKLSGAIEKFSKKLVTRCIYLNILMKTEASALDMYLDKNDGKGWDTLNIWLKDARDEVNQNFLIYLLDLLLLCPVTVERLKKNDTAKIVKSLSKSSTDPAVKGLADSVVTKWRSLIVSDAEQGNGSTSVVSKPKKSSVRKVLQSAAEAGTSDAVVVNDAGAGVVTTAGSNSDHSALSNGGIQNSGQGLAVAENNNKHKSGGNNNNNGSNTNNPGAGKNGPAASDANGNAAAVAAGPVPMVTSPSAGSSITPSDLFMSAIAAAADAAVSETPKRKKKLSSSSDSDVAHVAKKAKTTTVKNATTTDVLDPLLDETLCRMIEQDMDTEPSVPPFTLSNADLPITPPSTRSNSLSSPFTAPSAAVSTPLQRQRSSSGESGFTTPQPASSSSLFLQHLDQSDLLTPGPDKSYPRGCLRTSSVRKSVRWLPDQSITKIKFFDPTEDERVNVYRQQMQDQQNQGAESKTGEAHAFRDRSSNDAAGGDASRWAPLIVIDGTPGTATVTRGRDSKEKVIETERQSRTLAGEVFVSREHCPFTPAEPDPVSSLQSLTIGSSMTNPPVVIPQDDPIGSDQLSDWSQNGFPAPRNNPLFGETFLQPHQMELDVRHVIASPAIPVNAGAAAGVNPAAPSYATGMQQQGMVIDQYYQSVGQVAGQVAVGAAAAGPGFTFASSYERPFTGHPNNHNTHNHQNNKHHNRGPGNKNNHFNGNNNNRPGGFLPDYRDAQGRRVCTYFYKSGNCSRNPCKFIHTREAVAWKN